MEDKMKKLNLLIVEDEFLNRRLLVDYLKKFGPCHQAGNGKEALRAVEESYEKNEPFDMVFLDLVMPTMDGLTFLEAVRRLEERRGLPKGSGLKIFITSAVDDSRSIKAAETYQVLEYIAKPFSRESVAECVIKHAGL